MQKRFRAPQPGPVERKVGGGGVVDIPGQAGPFEGRGRAGCGGLPARGTHKPPARRGGSAGPPGHRTALPALPASRQVAFIYRLSSTREKIC